MKNVLVTGGAGYVGCVLVRELLKKGYGVRVLDTLVYGKEPLKEFKNKIELIKGDVRHPEKKYFKNIYAVIHLAGFSTEPTSQYDPRLTDMINHLATEKMAIMARDCGIKRFVYASSCSVYFTLNTPLVPPLYKESDPVNPISCYSLTKRCSEQLLWSMTNRDFQPTILRKGTVYGYSPRMRYDLVFNSFTKDAYLKKLLTVDAGGEIWRPMVDILDVAETYIKAIELPLSEIGGKTFNVINENFRIGDLALKIKNILEKQKKVKIALDIKPYGITRNYKADDTLFRKVFKFKPRRTMDETLFEIWDNIEKKKSDPTNPIHYGDMWYKHFYETKEGKKFKKHV